MNLDIVYLKALLLTSDESDFLDAQVPSEFLSGGYHKIYSYICEVFTKYKSKPDISHVENLFDVEIKSAASAPINQAKDLLRSRFGYEKLHTGIKEFTEEFASSAQKDIDQHIRDIVALALDVEKLSKSSASSGINLLDTSEYDFQQLMSGVSSQKSIDTPFPNLTERMGGLKPGDLVTLAARPGIGKTFMLLLFMIKAASQGKKCLLVTTEMSISQMKNRFISLFGNIHVGKPPRNQLTSMDCENLALKLNSVTPGSEIHAIEQGFSARVEDIEIDIMKKKPDFLCVDGFYLLKTKTYHRNKFDRIAEIIDAMKMYALKYNIPVLITTQMNRAPNESAGHKGKQKIPQIGGLERLAFSDNIAMVSDYVFFMDHPFMSSGKPIQNMMMIAPRKMRQVFMANAFENLPITWDINDLRFVEDLFWEHPETQKEIEKQVGWA